MAKNKKIASSNDANIRHLGQKLFKRHRNLLVYMIDPNRFIIMFQEESNSCLW